MAASRRRSLSRRRVLEAAGGLADREGLGALTMRRLGAELGVEAMSLYNHIPNKGALLDGIHERILLSLHAPGPTRSWQAYARHQALALHRALLAHPHAIPLFATRPAATPATRPACRAPAAGLRAAAPRACSAPPRPDTASP